MPDGAIPAIVAREEPEVAQVTLTRNKTAKAGATKHPEDHLLRGGYIRCGHCGGNMHAVAAQQTKTRLRAATSLCGTNQYKPDQCPFGGSVTTSVIDAAVWEKVLSRC